MKVRVILFLSLVGMVGNDFAYARSENGMNQTAQEGMATIRLTSFDVNEQSLRLVYRIANGSRHNVWICEAIDIERAGNIDHEVYVDTDGKTLVLRRSLQRPLAVVLPGALRIEGRYVRLCPGQERAGSILVPVPIRSRAIFAPNGPDVPTVSRVVLEVGFYNTDLPAKLKGILGLADTLRCTQPRAAEIDLDLFNEYFAGLALANAFGGVGKFPSFWKEGSDELKVPWVWPLLKEDSLEISLDPVLIPCTK